jgi:hypothetical protein
MRFIIGKCVKNKVMSEGLKKPICSSSVKDPYPADTLPHQIPTREWFPHESVQVYSLQPTSTLWQVD